MKNIEVEVRALVSGAEFNRLKKFFNKNAKFLNRHKDETVYFDKDGRVRLRREENRAYFVHKGGKIHDKHREEFEITINKPDFILGQKLLEALGKPPVVKWERERLVWQYQGMKAYLDNTKGYGRIFELEAVVAPKSREKAYNKMLGIFNGLKIKPTPKEKIQKHYNYYLKNWKKLI
jgi:predicted adenylyl cyclase CyaB